MLKICMSKWVSFLMLFSRLWHLLYQDRPFFLTWGNFPTPCLSLGSGRMLCIYLREMLIRWIEDILPIWAFLFVCLFGKHWFYWCLGCLAYQSNFSSTIFLTPMSDIYYLLVEIKNYCSEYLQSKDLEGRDFYENL